MIADKVKSQNWQKLSDEEILQMRIRDLGVSIADSWFEPLINRFYEQLDAKGILFHPPCYLADEWLCPDKEPIIGIPFFLAHPRLMHIEQEMMFDVEGGTEESCMKLLRHECGHALNYAYKLYTRSRWRQLFGRSSAKYSNSYHYQPYSRRYVIHLEGNYAQAHPDEDFAETFAVWLDPNNKWEQRYRGWPVIKKLRYIDSLIEKVGTMPPVVKTQGKPPWSASRKISTLASYYEHKRKELGSSFQGFYDDSLMKLFTKVPEGSSAVKASNLLRQNRKVLADYLAKWTGHRKYDIYQLVNTLAKRCDALNLYAIDGQAENMIGMTSLLAAIACDTLSSDKKR